MIPDQEIRIAAFEWLNKAVECHDDLLGRSFLATGFQFHDTRVPLLSPQGIFKPRICELPLSITTTTGGPYDDSFDPDGLLSYRYRRDDPDHRDNRGLRRAMLESVPLVYFHSVIPGRYLAVYPVYIAGDEPDALTFTVAADDVSVAVEGSDYVTEDPMPRRQYITTCVRQRLHQRGFHERVLHA